MKNNKGFATSFMLFSLLALFLIVVMMLLLTMNNSSSISGRMKDAIKDKAENSMNNRQSSSNTDYVQNNLLLYYDALDHGDGNSTWDDLSGNGNDGVITNGTFKNNTLSLSGSGSGVVSTNMIDYKPNMTFEVTLYPNITGNSYVLDARKSDGDGYQPLHLYSDYRGEIYSKPGGAFTQSMNYLSENIHTLSIVYTSSGVTFYKNGAQVSTNNVPKGVTYTANLFIGRYALENTVNFKGNIYSVRVYDKALDINEIRANYTYDAKRYILQKDNEYTYEYTGSYQTFTAPATSNYKIEAWGAQGGTVGNKLGGNGAYTSGNIELTKGQKLYLYIGSQPQNAARQNGGYNGGGNVSPNDDGTGRAGGGATDIRLVSGDWNNEASLASRIMVASGGGGSACEGGDWCASGGAGGGLIGLNPTSMGSRAATCHGTGGTQTSGGNSIDTDEHRPSGLSYLGTFGIGGSSGSNDDSGAGGAGYYGGGGSNYASAGGGGSSYISGHLGCVAIQAQDNITPKNGCTDGTEDITCSYHYSNKIFTNTIMKAGNEEMPTFNGSGSMTGNSGNGFVKITVLGSD
ncbi:MAG: hypothetical protein J6O62_00070 [Bacilli bacterium]|nr:hypothetical protein [Bacilli bacterium]